MLAPSLSYYPCSTLPAFGAPRHRHFHVSSSLRLGPATVMVRLAQSRCLRHMRLAAQVHWILRHPTPNEATRCLVASAEPISVHLIYCWCVSDCRRYSALHSAKCDHRHHREQYYTLVPVVGSTSGAAAPAPAAAPALVPASLPWVVS